MSGKERGDCFEKTVEERLAEAALREELRERGRRCGAEGRYLRVGDYDPVLRWHCRLTNPDGGGAALTPSWRSITLKTI